MYVVWLTARSHFGWLAQGKCLEWEKWKTTYWNCNVEFRTHFSPQSTRNSDTRFGYTAPEMTRAARPLAVLSRRVGSTEAIAQTS